MLPSECRKEELVRTIQEVPQGINNSTRLCFGQQSWVQPSFNDIVDGFFDTTSRTLLNNTRGRMRPSSLHFPLPLYLTPLPFLPFPHWLETNSGDSDNFPLFDNDSVLLHVEAALIAANTIYDAEFESPSPLKAYSDEQVF